MRHKVGRGNAIALRHRPRLELGGPGYLRLDNLIVTCPHRAECPASTHSFLIRFIISARCNDGTYFIPVRMSCVGIVAVKYDRHRVLEALTLSQAYRFGTTGGGAWIAAHTALRAGWWCSLNLSIQARRLAISFWQLASRWSCA